MNILITGATDGIGLALARHYAQQGARLVLVGRRPLAALKDALFSAQTYCEADLAHADAPARISAFLQAQNLQGLDLLIHNAGIGEYGAIAEQTPEHIRELIAVNLRAPIALTHALLPNLLVAYGQLVFISSVVTVLPTPRYAYYTTSKAALDAFARDLRIELRGQATVQVIHPGATRTGMLPKSGAPLDALGWARYASPDAVAASIARAIARRRAEATIGLGNRALRWAGKYWGGVVDILAARRP